MFALLAGQCISLSNQFDLAFGQGAPVRVIAGQRRVQALAAFRHAADR